MGVAASESMIARPIALLLVGFDTDRDLATSAAEFDAGLRTEFLRADANKDGLISGFEMQDWSALMMGDKEAQPDYRAMNSDLGQAVSAQEFETAFKREFAAMDRNGDGKLTRAELLNASPRMGMGMGGPPGGGQMMRRGGRGGPGGGMPPG